MSDDNEKKFNIIINEQDEKVDLGKNFSAQYRLILYDKNGEEIKQASKVNNETTATLQVFIKNNAEKFPDKLNDFTYQLQIKNYELSPDGKYKIIASVEEREKIESKINDINGKLVRDHFTNDLGVGRSLEGSDDIKFKIESNDGNKEVDRGIRIDIYKCPNNSEIALGQKRIQGIANDQLDIDLIWNRHIQFELKQDALKWELPEEPKGWWTSPWFIGAMVVLGVLAILVAIFHRKIREWWKKRKEKKEAQLEVF